MDLADVKAVAQEIKKSLVPLGFDMSYRITEIAPFLEKNLELQINVDFQLGLDGGLDVFIPDETIRICLSRVFRPSDTAYVGAVFIESILSEVFKNMTGAARKFADRSPDCKRIISKLT